MENCRTELSGTITYFHLDGEKYGWTLFKSPDIKTLANNEDFLSLLELWEGK